MRESHRRVQIKGATGRASRDTLKGKPWGEESERKTESVWEGWIIPLPQRTYRTPDDRQRVWLVAVQLKRLVNQLLMERDRKKQKQRERGCAGCPVCVRDVWDLFYRTVGRHREWEEVKFDQQGNMTVALAQNGCELLKHPWGRTLKDVL